jgi:hypothetical protein
VSAPPRSPRRLGRKIPGELLAALDRDGLEFRLLRPDEVTEPVAREMIALFRAGFGRWPFQAVPSDLDYLRWKMSGPASVYGSFQGRLHGRLVYATIVFASFVRVGGSRLRRLTFLDACVDPSMRGRGIYSKSTDYQEHLDYDSDFSMHERSSRSEVIRRQSRRDQRPVGNQIQLLSRVLDPSAVTGEIPGWSPRATRAALHGASLIGSAMAAAQRGSSFDVGAASFDERYDALFAAAASSFDFIAERGREFLRWRYADPRAGRCIAREVVDRGELVGYAVVRPSGEQTSLADLLVMPGRLDAVLALATDAVEVARESGAALVDCWLPRRHPYRAALRRVGFLRRADAGVSFHPIQASDEELAPLAEPGGRLHYTLGDTDLV